MNESETRAEYIDPKLKASGWGEVEGSKSSSGISAETVSGTVFSYHINFII